MASIERFVGNVGRFLGEAGRRIITRKPRMYVTREEAMIAEARDILNSERTGGPIITDLGEDEIEKNS